jgi:hypothetical protein
MEATAAGRAKSAKYSSTLRSTSSWLPYRPTHTVPTQMSSAPVKRERVSRSLSVHGASSTFHTTTMPAHGAMIDCAAKP